MAPTTSRRRPVELNKRAPDEVRNLPAGKQLDADDRIDLGSAASQPLRHGRLIDVEQKSKLSLRHAALLHPLVQRHSVENICPRTGVKDYLKPLARPVHLSLGAMGLRDDDKVKRTNRDNLNRFMAERGFDASQLAMRSGVDIDTIRKYRQSKASRGMGPGIISSLARGLQCDEGCFFKEHPGQLPPLRPMAFSLNVFSDDVDDELRQRAEEMVAQLNREYATRHKSRRATGATTVKPADAKGMTSVIATAPPEKGSSVSRPSGRDRPYQQKPARPPRKRQT